MGSSTYEKLPLNPIIGYSKVGIKNQKYGWIMNRGGFSWNRFLGISAFKSRISKFIGIPFTRSGRERKLGALVKKLLKLIVQKVTTWIK